MTTLTNHNSIQKKKKLLLGFYFFDEGRAEVVTKWNKILKKNVENIKLLVAAAVAEVVVVVVSWCNQNFWVISKAKKP